MQTACVCLNVLPEFKCRIKLDEYYGDLVKRKLAKAFEPCYAAEYPGLEHRFSKWFKVSKSYKLI